MHADRYRDSLSIDLNTVPFDRLTLQTLLPSLCLIRPHVPTPLSKSCTTKNQHNPKNDLRWLSSDNGALFEMLTNSELGKREKMLRGSAALKVTAHLTIDPMTSC